MKIIVLPGLDGTGDFLDKFKNLFAHNHSVQVMHYPVELHKYADIYDWLHNRLPKEDYVIIAESFSGPLTTQIATSHPANLKGVVFVATFVRPPRKIPPMLANLLWCAPLKSKLLIRISLPLLMGRFASQDFANSMYSTLQNIPKQTIIGRIKETLRVDLSDALQSIQIPCAYLMATKDSLLSKHIPHDFEKNGFEIMVLEGPHFILQSKPHEAHEIISTTLKSWELGC